MKTNPRTAATVLKNQPLLKQVRALVGPVTREQMRFVEIFVSGPLGLFIPSVGPCDYAISRDHTHPAYSFILNFDDHSEICVGARRFRSQPGKLCAVSPGVPHHEILTARFARYVAIMINRRYFERQLAACAIAERRLFRGEMAAVPHELKLYLKDFMSEYENRLPGHEILLQAAAVRITHTIIRALHGVCAAREGSAQRMQIDRVVEYIHGHYPEKLDVLKLAEVAALSASHFTRLFKASVGKPPMAFLTETRLEKAKALLRSREFSITEIAHRTGFSSSSHFASQFSARYKHTPRAYQKSMP